MAVIYEGATGLITGILKDTGTGLGLQPQTLSVLIYDRDSGTVILTDTPLAPVATYVDAGGNLIYYISAANNTILDNVKQQEIHVARFTWTWTAGGGTQTAKEELQFVVTNLTP